MASVLSEDGLVLCWGDVDGDRRRLLRICRKWTERIVPFKAEGRGVGGLSLVAASLLLSNLLCVKG